VENPFSGLSAEDAELLELGGVLGEHHAFALVAGRCSAAQAQCLKKLREEKKYKRLNPDWREFCAQYLNISGAQADRIIALLEEFGPGYFELSQLTRISADTYRAIAPVVKDHALHFNGEAIELNPENARRVAAAVAELRRAAAVKPPPAPKGMESAIEDIDKRFAQIVEDIEHLLRQSDQNWSQFAAAVDRMSLALARLIKENRI